MLALLGIVALGAYGFVAALQPDAHFGRVLAAYGGVFVAGSLAWGIVVDGFRPTVWDYVGFRRRARGGGDHRARAGRGSGAGVTASGVSLAQRMDRLDRRVVS